MKVAPSSGRVAYRGSARVGTTSSAGRQETRTVICSDGAIGRGVLQRTSGLDRPFAASCGDSSGPPGRGSRRRSSCVPCRNLHVGLTCTGQAASYESISSRSGAIHWSKNRQRWSTSRHSPAAQVPLPLLALGSSEYFGPNCVLSACSIFRRDRSRATLAFCSSSDLRFLSGCRGAPGRLAARSLATRKRRSCWPSVVALVWRRRPLPTLQVLTGVLPDPAGYPGLMSFTRRRLETEGIARLGASS